MAALAACGGQPHKKESGLVNQFAQGNYLEAHALLENSVRDEDAFLLLVQSAVVDAQQGNFKSSNEKLERAKRRSDELYTRTVSEAAKASLSSETALQYRPTPLEQSFLSYKKATNYLNEEAGEWAQQNQDAALVELRYLETLQYEKRFLDNMGIPGRGKPDLANFILDSLGKRAGDMPAFDVDSPWVYAISALVYDRAGENEDALRAFERALEQSEGLSDELRALLQAEATRVLKKVTSDLATAESYGVSQWLELADIDWAEQEVSESSWLLLEQGAVGELQSLEILLTTDSVQRRIILRPILKGSEAAKLNQAAEFAALSKLYSSEYKDAIILNLDENWKTAESLGLTDVVGGGVRIFVPFYTAETTSAADLTIDGQPVEGIALADFTSFLRSYYSENLRREFEEAVLREMSKNATYKSLTAGIKLPFSVGGALATFTAAADLRQCSLIPGRIQLFNISDWQAGKTISYQGQTLTLSGENHIHTVRVGQ
ncbi:hypothetical protein IB286_01895 [Spongiibacter sp. KMU-158]|uniref:Uncharacterized protein n=1 Tax=Spongiibacter pelagi TaxID=2760804 RepID=A0A927C158_9GAMM|nr:hypothetical protein [Spongiibacter pelagi]MBD2857741.1 hypothetical protein [Spongiibacter pelagi]